MHKTKQLAFKKTVCGKEEAPDTDYLCHCDYL